MKTAFQTGPGFFAANDCRHEPAVPPGVMRVYCARLEAYDIEPEKNQDDAETSFELLVAKAEGNPELARVLLRLKEALIGNSPLLERIARA